MPHLSLFFLGSPRIEKDGQSIELNNRKVMALLTYVAITGQEHRRDRLVDLLWPESDQSRGRNDLRQTLFLLKKTLGDDCLKSDGETIRLVPNADLWVDVKQFHNLLLQCRGHGHSISEVCPSCLKPLREAVELYKDDFLTGFSLQDSVNFDDWQFSQAQSLRSEMTDGLGSLVSCLSEQGEYEKAVEYSQRWLKLDRADEEGHRRLMELYARTGRRTAALRQYEECVRILKEDLNSLPQEETTELYESIKGNAFSMEKVSSTKRWIQKSEVSSYKPSDPPTNNLPRQLTSFIGRKSEIAEIKKLLATTYLLTLTGSGGCGKTRLALEVATNLVEEYSDGVWLVELASLSDPGLVPQEIASALDVSEQPDRSISDTLLDYLRSKQLLLILDNCEHVIEACIRISDILLRSCPNLRIIVASREALGIAGETTYQVPSLSTPDPKELPPVGTDLVSALTTYEAISLFEARALAVQPTFTVTDGNALALAQICHRLDGIPLAIELAAVRVKVLSVEQNVRRLDDRFRLLTGGSRSALPRQQTLRATIDWSYNQLSEPECLLLDRLSVFMGGWTLDAAEAICRDEMMEEDEILDLLVGLADKSLVIIEEFPSTEEDGGEVRYRLLETVRGYARDKLLESGEVEGLRHRHLEWYLDLAERAEPELFGPAQVEWTDRLEVEHDNLRVALEWSLRSGFKQGSLPGEPDEDNPSESGDSGKSLSDSHSFSAEMGLRLAGALYWFWAVSGYYNEGYRWLDEALSKRTKSASARAKALRGAGFLLYVKSDYKKAVALYNESLALFQELGDKRGVADLLRKLGNISGRQGDYVRGIVLLEEGLALFREVGDKQGIANVLLILGDQVSDQGDHERAIALCEESLALRRELGNKGGFSLLLLTLGRVLWKQGDLERAKKLIEESLPMSRELGFKRLTSQQLHLLGLVALGGDDHDLATQLLKESLALNRELGEKHFIAHCFEGLAGVAVTRGESERGARLLGASERIRKAIAAPLRPSERAEVDGYMASMRAELEEEAFAAAWAEGGKMTIEEAIEYALTTGH